jgi:glycosyltransferase involved in cell wall biosynthesis
MVKENHFTVLIPTYNRADYLKYTLETCRNVNFKEVDFIVLDDCSNDNTKEIVQNFIKIDSRFKLIESSKNLGMRLNFERGIELAQDWVMYLGGDDALFPDIFQKLNLVINRNDVSLITWPTCAYLYNETAYKGQIIYPIITKKKGFISAQDFYTKQTNNLYYVTDQTIPMIYVKGIVRKRTITEYLRSTSNSQFFTQPTPDGFSAFALMSVEDNYYFINDVLTMHGIGSKSTGMAHLQRNSTEQIEISNQFFKSAINDQMSEFLANAEYSVLITLMTVDYLKAVRSINPIPANSVIDSLEIKEVIRRSFQELEDGIYGETARERELKLLKYICEKHGLNDFYSEMFRLHKVNLRTTLTGSAISTKNIYINAKTVDVENVHDAVAYLQSKGKLKVLMILIQIFSFKMIYNSFRHFILSFRYQK